MASIIHVIILQHDRVLLLRRFIWWQVLRAGVLNEQDLPNVQELIKIFACIMFANVLLAKAIHKAKPE